MVKTVIDQVQNRGQKATRDQAEEKYRKTTRTADKDQKEDRS